MSEPLTQRVFNCRKIKAKQNWDQFTDDWLTAGKIQCSFVKVLFFQLEACQRHIKSLDMTLAWHKLDRSVIPSQQAEL